jgi:translation initiation factor IF-2
VAVIEGRPPVILPKQISVRELATALDVSIVDLMRALVNMGTMASINTTIDFDTASLVATELGIETKAEEEAPPPAEDAEAEIAPLKPELWTEDDASKLKPRRPLSRSSAMSTTGRRVSSTPSAPPT